MGCPLSTPPLKLAVGVCRGLMHSLRPYSRALAGLGRGRGCQQVSTLLARRTASAGSAAFARALSNLRDRKPASAKCGLRFAASLAPHCRPLAAFATEAIHRRVEATLSTSVCVAGVPVRRTR